MACEHKVIFINGICNSCKEQVKPNNFFLAEKKAATNKIHSANRMKYDAEITIRQSSRELAEIDKVLKNYPQKAR